MTNILVTGGAGFIGSNLVHELIKDSQNNIVVLDNFSTGKKENLALISNNPRLKVIEGDITNKNLVDDITKNIDMIYHLAVQCVRLSFSNPDLVHEVNSTGTLNLLNSAVKNKIKKFVYVSSSESYGTALTNGPMDENHPLRPTTVYGASKAAGELYTIGTHISHNLPMVIIRPFNSYGPYEHYEGVFGEVIPKFIIRAYNDQPLLIHGDGEQTRDFTYVLDTVKGMILAANNDKLIGQAVNIAYGREVSINNIAKAVLKATGKTVPVEHTPNRPGDVRRHFADITKAKSVLGFKPEMLLEEGIVKYINWLKNQNFDFKKALTEEVPYNWKTK